MSGAKVASAGPAAEVTGDARSHYDQYPYEVGARPSSYLSDAGPLGAFLRDIDGGRVVDLGCGPANVLPAIAGRAASTVGVDVSVVTLRRAAERLGPAVALVQADARHLPVRESSVDRVLATGSLHHTGDAAAGFSELARVLRAGGRGFVAVYAARSYYEWLYGAVGRVARWAKRRRASDLVVNWALLLPLFAVYVLAGRIASRRRLKGLSLDQLRNYFADQLLNPVVSFHSVEEVCGWAAACGLIVVATARSHAGALLSVLVAKPGGEDRQ